MRTFVLAWIVLTMQLHYSPATVSPTDPITETILYLCNSKNMSGHNSTDTVEVGKYQWPKVQYCPDTRPGVNTFLNNRQLLEEIEYMVGFSTAQGSSAHT